MVAAFALGGSSAVLVLAAVFGLRRSSRCRTSLIVHFRLGLGEFLGFGVVFGLLLLHLLRQGLRRSRLQRERTREVNREQERVLKRLSGCERGKQNSWRISKENKTLLLV